MLEREMFVTLCRAQMSSNPISVSCEDSGVQRTSIRGLSDRPASVAMILSVAEVVSGDPNAEYPWAVTSIVMGGGRGT